MRSPELHRAVGAYAIGVLGPADAFRFEEHLVGCPRCAVLLEEFGSVEALLADYARQLPPGVEPGVPTSEALLHRLLDGVRARRRSVRTRRLALVAAAVVLAGGGTFSVARPAGDGPGAGVRWAATDRTTGVSAAVAVRSADWGTDVEVDVRDAPHDEVCSLVAVGWTGEVQTVATWAAGRRGPLQAKGAAALPPDAIDHFEVRTSGGKRLLSVGPQIP
ncbi:zf-HC2 domain-containing protein [Streptomyces sp. NPDC051322]|uniref:zf-HC2 domain-containing protein n=1 Tax=Streptomyces sp. NPDC051322 TaxID=3154645 RepID=UPI00344CE846